MAGFVFYLHLLASPIRSVTFVRFVPKTMLPWGIGLRLSVLEKFEGWVMILVSPATQSFVYVQDTTVMLSREPSQQ